MLLSTAFLAHRSPPKSLLWVCSDEKCELCAKRGASHVINYKTEDFADVVNSMTKVGTPPRQLPPQQMSPLLARH